MNISLSITEKTLFSQCFYELLLFLQPYNVLAQPIKQAKAAGYRLDSRVLDINHVDVSIGDFPTCNYL